ncbi:MAG: Mth938-like domain-containing protein [Phycisphaerae bacterium]
MHIDSYQFGKIVIDGVDYSSDCLILGDKVQSNWRRKRGHLLSEEDLEPVIKAKPTLLIVGCGASGLMKIPNETRDFLLQEDIQMEATDTARAVERFNELSQTKVKVAAAIHLTC